MAATRLIALHKNKGKSVAACLKSRTDYAQNPDKTEQGELISSYELKKCSSVWTLPLPVIMNWVIPLKPLKIGWQKLPC